MSLDDEARDIWFSKFEKAQELKPEVGPLTRS